MRSGVETGRVLGILSRVNEQRCAHLWGGLECQLAAGHRSAHAAWTDGALASWVHPGAGDDGSDVKLEWFDRPADRTDVFSPDA